MNAHSFMHNVCTKRLSIIRMILVCITLMIRVVVCRGIFESIIFNHLFSTWNILCVKMPPKKQANKSLLKYVIYKYTVVKFEEEDLRERSFECIPDRWFLDETKTRCYWPPCIGTPFAVRAMRCEKPDDSWSIYNVIVVSDGHGEFHRISEI